MTRNAELDQQLRAMHKRVLEKQNVRADPNAAHSPPLATGALRCVNVARGWCRLRSTRLLSARTLARTYTQLITSRARGAAKPLQRPRRCARDAASALRC